MWNMASEKKTWVQFHAILPDILSSVQGCLSFLAIIPEIEKDNTGLTVIKPFWNLLLYLRIEFTILLVCET